MIFITEIAGDIKMRFIIILSMLCVILFSSAVGSEFSIKRWLEQLTLAEKQNTEIQLELQNDAGDDALAIARQIEKEWNNGSFDNALKRFDDLSILTDLSRASLYENWKTPVICSTPDKFGDDVLIMNRDSVKFIELEIHPQSGNLIAIALVEGDGSTNILMAVVSTDGGATWNEGTRMHISEEIFEISAAIHDDHCYVIYYYDKIFSVYDQIRISRFNCFTGYREDFPGGLYSLDIIDGYFKDVEITCANYGLQNHYIYFCFLRDNGDLHTQLLNMEDFYWTQLQVLYGEVDRGLDIAAAVSLYYPIFISYIKSNDYVIVARYQGTQNQYVSMYSNYLGGSTPDETALDVYGTDVVCIYEHVGSSHEVYEAYSTDIAVNWGTRNLETSVYSPSLTMRGGAGLARAYNKQVMYPVRTGRFRWVSQDSIHVSNELSVQYTDHWTAFQQDIEYIGGGNYGIAYMSSDFQAWFDKGSGCCQVRGDVALPKDGIVLVNDIVWLVDYLFKGGAAPACLTEGDCAIPLDDAILVNDIVWLVDYLFKGGTAPPDC